MKNLQILLIPLIVVAFSTLKLDAQIEPKINPLAVILSGDVVLGCEFILSDKIGVEPIVDFGRTNLGLTGIAEEVSFTGFGLRAIGKYYFNPEVGADKFYLGPYLKYKGGVGSSDISNDEFIRTRVAAGLAVGYKVVSQSGIVFEVGVGGGRAFTDTVKNRDTDEEFAFTDLTNIDLLARLALGYRFGGSSNKSMKGSDKDMKSDNDRRKKSSKGKKRR